MTSCLPATNRVGVIVGAVIGALLLLLLLLLAIWLTVCCCLKLRYEKEVANEIRYRNGEHIESIQSYSLSETRVFRQGGYPRPREPPFQ